MSYLRTALLAVSAAGLSSLSSVAFAEALAAPYDPVAYAISHGLTPEALDAAFDRALASVEGCDAFAVQMQSIACASQEGTEVNLAALPMLGS